MSFIAAPRASTAILISLGMAATVGTALGFQHIGGFIPCKLCLEQRIPYYIGIPVMAAAAISAALGGPFWLTRGLFAVGGALMLWGVGLGVYHSGVEWGWWQGPTDCGAVAPVDTGGKGVLDAIDNFVPPSCDKAALRILGLSFAGWNVLASLLWAGLAFKTAFKDGRKAA